MDEVDEEYLLFVLFLRRRRRRMRKIVGTARTKHKFCIRNIYRNRDEISEYHSLVQDLFFFSFFYIRRKTKYLQ